MTTTNMIGEPIVTHLRKLMLEELERRNYAQATARAYVHALKDFATYPVLN
jgi:integrase/recombinase XerD